MQAHYPKSKRSTAGQVALRFGLVCRRTNPKRKRGHDRVGGHDYGTVVGQSGMPLQRPCWDAKKIEDPLSYRVGTTRFKSRFILVSPAGISFHRGAGDEMKRDCHGYGSASQTRTVPSRPPAAIRVP